MDDVTVRVRGLDETARAFRQLKGRASGELKDAMKEIAKHVIRVARGKMEFGPGPAASSLTPRATDHGAGIAYPRGGPESRNDRAGEYPWLDFGGGAPNARGVTSSTGASHERSRSQRFRRPVPKGGRYLYPAIAESTDFIRDAVDDAMEDAIKGVGFGTYGKVA